MVRAAKRRKHAKGSAELLAGHRELEKLETMSHTIASAQDLFHPWCISVLRNRSPESSWDISSLSGQRAKAVEHLAFFGFLQIELTKKAIHHYI